MKKLNLGEGGVQALLTKHVEKIVFGVCLTLVVLFIFLGLRLKGYDGEPTQMQQLAEQARTNIATNSWEAVQAEPERITLTKYSEEVKAGSARTEGGAYPYTKPLQPPIRRQLEKRGDPELYAPENLIVYSVTAPIAVKQKESRGVDRLAELETKMVEPPKEPRVDRREQQQARRGGGGVPRGSAFPGTAGGPGGGVRGSSPLGSGGPTGSIPFAPGGASTSASPVASQERPKIYLNPEGWRPGGMLGAMSGMSSGGMSSGAMGSGAMSSGAMRSSGAMSSAMGPGGAAMGPGGAAMGPAGPSGTTADEITYEPAHFVVVMCPVPYEKQFDQFKLVFENAVGYDPGRDRPRYLAFRVERAEVTGDPNAPLEWVNVGGTSSALKEMNRWAGQMPEVAHPLYVDPVLTMPIPPVLLKDMKSFVNHPSIPEATEQLPTAMTNMMAMATTESTDTSSEVTGDIPSANLLRNSATPGMAGGMMSSGAMGSGAMGSGMMSSGAMGSGAMGSGAMGSGAMGSSGMMSSGAMGSGMMSGGGARGSSPMMGSSPMGGMMPGMGMNAVVAKYKLLRYFDFTAEPGKVYQYRVQLYVEDPNHPQQSTGTATSAPNMFTQVQLQMLKEDAAARVSKLKPSEYFRLTDWSSESPAVSLPPAEKFFVGTTDRASLASHPNGAKVFREPLSAQFAGVVWDENLAVDVSTSVEAFSGSVLNKQDDIDVPHPLTLEFKVLEEYDLRSNAVIADMRGGETVGGKSNEPLHSPIEAAIVDAQGNLVVRNEIDDIEAYRRFAYVQEEPQGPGMGAMGAGGASMPQGMPAMGSMPAAASGMMGPGGPGSGGGGRRGGGRRGR